MLREGVAFHNAEGVGGSHITTAPQARENGARNSTITINPVQHQSLIRFCKSKLNGKESKNGTQDFVIIVVNHENVCMKQKSKEN